MYLYKNSSNEINLLNIQMIFEHLVLVMYIMMENNYKHFVQINIFIPFHTMCIIIIIIIMLPVGYLFFFF